MISYHTIYVLVLQTCQCQCILGFFFSFVVSCVWEYKKEIQANMLPSLATYVACISYIQVLLRIDPDIRRSQTFGPFESSSSLLLTWISPVSPFSLLQSLPLTFQQEDQTSEPSPFSFPSPRVHLLGLEDQTSLPSFSSSHIPTVDPGDRVQQCDFFPWQKDQTVLHAA